MLSRSALGSPITQMTSHFRAPRPGTEMHVVLVDNHRSERLGMADFWTSLKCIRCGACMNTCPVFRRSGGYSYGTTVPGPIGVVYASTHASPIRHFAAKWSRCWRARIRRPVSWSRTERAPLPRRLWPEYLRSMNRISAIGPLKKAVYIQ